jgi:hypothetical protein
VNIKIAGKWMFIPLKMVLIGIDPYPNLSSILHLTPKNPPLLWPRPGLVLRPRIGPGWHGEAQQQWDDFMVISW